MRSVAGSKLCRAEKHTPHMSSHAGQHVLHMLRQLCCVGKHGAEGPSQQISGTKRKREQDANADLQGISSMRVQVCLGCAAAVAACDIARWCCAVLSCANTPVYLEPQSCTRFPTSHMQALKGHEQPEFLADANQHVSRASGTDAWHFCTALLYGISAWHCCMTLLSSSTPTVSRKCQLMLGKSQMQLYHIMSSLGNFVGNRALLAVAQQLSQWLCLCICSITVHSPVGQQLCSML